MATLQADLTLKLDARSLITSHFGSGGAGGSIAGPLASLQAVVLPLDIDALTAIAGGATTFDAGGIIDAVAGVAADAGGVVGTLPVVGDLITPIDDAVSLVQVATGDSLGVELSTLITRLRAELDAPRDGGFIETLIRVQSVLTELGASGALSALITPITALIPPFAATLAEVLPALNGLARAMGGLMSLESVLSESERLTAILAQQVNPSALEQELAQLETLLSGGPASLATRIGALAGATESQVVQVAADVAKAAERIRVLLERMATAMGSGEATLVYLDVATVLAEVDAAMKMAAGADLAPTGRVLTAAVDAVRPYLPDLRGAPSFSLDDFVTMVESRVAEFAGGIQAFDVTQPVLPIVTAIETVTAPIASLENILEALVAAVRSALTQVQDAVAALPVQPIATAIQAVVDPVAEAIDTLTELLADVQAALEAVAAQVTSALGDVESALDAAKEQIDAFFGDASEFIDEANLSGVADTVNGALGELLTALDKAQMQPYFDAAADAIDTAADVIGKVPFALLPESVKAEVDAAVAPIKEADAQAAADQVKQVLQLDEEGKFAARAQLEEAIAGVAAQYQALVAAIAAHDPRIYLAEIDAQLQAVGEQIETLQPLLTLQPVQDVITQVKASVAAIDVAQQLAPLTSAFDQILAAIDQYSPEALIAPIEEKVDEAREGVRTVLRLDEWRPTIDDVAARTIELLDAVDPARLTDTLEEILTQVQGLLAQGVDSRVAGAIGTLAALALQGTGLRIYPRSFDPALDWLGGASAAQALGGRASRIAASMRQASNVVAGIDPLDIQRRLAPGLAAVEQAASGLAPDLPGRTTLDIAVSRLDFDDAIVLLSANRDRFAASLDASAADVETLERTGFGQADDVVSRLRTALAPLTVFSDLARDFFTRIGVPGLEKGLASAFGGVLAVIPPARITGIVRPIVIAVHERLQAFLDAILDPIRDGIDEVTALIDRIDLGPVREEIAAIVDEVKQQISSLSPTALLAAPLASLTALQAQVAAFDPIAAMTAIITALQEAAASLLEKLSAETLLEAPLAIYDEIMSALAALDPAAMLAPLFDQLDEIAGQVSEGLERTVEAFEHLQESLPSGGGGLSGVAGSIGVEIGF